MMETFKIKTIPGFDGYSASENGIIFYEGSIARIYHTGRYLGVSIYGKTKLVHRLIALTFIGNIDGLCVMHIDDNTLNNHITNLRIGSQKENVHDMINKGRGSQYGKGVGLSLEEKKSIILSGMTNKKITQVYGVHRNTAMNWRKMFTI